MYKVTVFNTTLMEALGLVPDCNSKPEICEWYYTMSLEDFIALRRLWLEYNPENELRASWILG